MVPFGGYEMPVQYSDLSIGESHKWTREKASIFDVGHMVQHSLKGPGAEALLETLTPVGLASLEIHRSGLTCFLNEEGGIQDDSIITRLGPQSFYFVTNAGRRESDHAYLEKHIAKWNSDGKPEVQWQVMDGQGLIALQGPLAAELLQPLLVNIQDDKLEGILFGQSKFLKLKLPSGAESSPILVSRGGYTGEDGFEISIPANETEPVVNFLLTTAGPEKLRMAGLGARDSLRLEAGMCLYGHDLDETTTPVEGGLSWTISKDRRLTGGFNGSEKILQQLKPKKDGGSGVPRRRVGFIVEGSPAREGAHIKDAEGNAIGKVTSGCPSPTLGKHIAMGYVSSGHNKAGTELLITVRGKPRKATVTKMPFVPSRYWKGGASPG